MCRVERGATPRKLAHEGTPSYASTSGIVSSGLPSSQSLPPQRPVPVPGISPPAFPPAAAPRPSAQPPAGPAASQSNGDAKV